MSGDEATAWQTIGWIQEEHLRGAPTPFFCAIWIHPVHFDPNTSRQYLGLETRR